MSSNPECRTDSFVGDILHDLGSGVFRRFDIVLGCLDNNTTRLYAAHRCAQFSKPHIDSGINQLGMTVSVHHYPYSSCLACGMDLSSVSRERMVRHSCDEFKRRVINERHAATVILSAATAGAIQAQEAVKALHSIHGIKLDAPVRFSKQYILYGSSNIFVNSDIPVNDDCPAHDTLEDVIETLLSAKQTLGEVLDDLETILGYPAVIDTYPDSVFITGTICPICRREIVINKPKHTLYTDDLYCEECRSEASPGPYERVHCHRSFRQGVRPSGSSSHRAGNSSTPCYHRTCKGRSRTLCSR